jgi:hypothetical protein
MMQLTFISAIVPPCYAASAIDETLLGVRISCIVELTQCNSEEGPRS